MWKKAIGFGLILFGAASAIVSAKNLWTIQAAWHDLDSKSFAGIEFLKGSNVAETLQNLWAENLITMLGAALIAVTGIVVLIKSRWK